MKSIDQRAFVRLVWLAVVAVLCAGYGVIWLPKQAMLTRIRERAHDFYERANSNEEIVRRSQRLRAAEDRVRHDLARLEGQTTSGRVTASALQVLDVESKTYGVAVRSVIPDSGAETSEAIGTSRLVGRNVAFELRGRFRNLIAFLTDVPRHGVLLEIRGAQLASLDSDRMAPEPALRATIQTTLYRVSASRVEGHDVTAVAR